MDWQMRDEMLSGLFVYSLLETLMFSYYEDIKCVLCEYLMWDMLPYG